MGGVGGPSAKDKRQAAQLMQSTETLMKFGFMSMSMTYFSSLNMIRAMRSVGATDTVMAALAHNSNAAEARSQAGGGGGGDSGGGGGGEIISRALALEQNEKLGAEPFRPALKPGRLPGQEPLQVAAWSVDDVARWLQASEMLVIFAYVSALVFVAWVLTHACRLCNTKYCGNYFFLINDHCTVSPNPPQSRRPNHVPSS